MAILQANHIYPLASASGTEYNDVPSDHPNAVWIEQFKTEMYSDGCTTDRFCPKDAVTVEVFENILNAAFS